MQPNPQDLPIPSDFTSPKEAEFEILVKGLPPDTTDIQLAEVFGEVGPVLKVRLVPSKSDSLKSAYLRFASREAVDRAKSLRSFRRFPISTEIVEPHPSLNFPSARSALKFPIQSTGESQEWLTTLLGEIRSHSDPMALTAASIHTEIEQISGTALGRPMSDDEDNSEMQSDAVLKPEMQEYLSKFPNCKSLMVKIRMIPNNDNKTPISVINEYAKRTGLNLQYSMPNDMNVGPYYVECKLMSNDRSRVYADGRGEASTKKEARQIASADAIENLLKTVKEAEFMTSGKSKLYGTSSMSGYPPRN